MAYIYVCKLNLGGKNNYSGGDLKSCNYLYSYETYLKENVVYKETISQHI